MQASHKTVTPARPGTALAVLTALLFVLFASQRCSIPARQPGAQNQSPPPKGGVAAESGQPGSGMSAGNASKPVPLADSFADAVSYPGTILEPKAEGTDAKSLEKAIGAANGPGVSAAVYFSQPHSLLDSMLRDVNFVRAHVENDFDLEGWDSYAVKDGKLQRLDALNRLLLDVGFTFDSTEMPTIAKIAVLFATFGKTFDASGQLRDAPMPTDSTPGAGFPAITFLSVKKGEWKHPVHKDIRRGVLMDCVMEGKRENLFVWFAGRQPEYVLTTDGKPVGQRFRPAGPQRGSLRGYHGGGMPEVPTWELTVAGDTWTERDGDIRHYFVAAEVNGSPTSATIILNVSNATGDSVHLRFLRLQDQDTAFRTRPVVGGLAADTWRPTYDSTAEYAVAAYDVVNDTLVSNEVIVDPEAWRVQMTSDTSWIRVRYMNYNDHIDHIPSFAPYAETTAATICTSAVRAWNVEVDTWSVPVEPQNDTFDVIMGTSYAGGSGQLPWYHLPWRAVPYYSSDIRVYMPGDADYLWSSNYPNAEEAYDNICSHELWHACQGALRSGHNLARRFRWITEGQAVAIPSVLYPQVEIATNRGVPTHYRQRSWEYQRAHLAIDPYSADSNDWYRFGIFWRHLYETGGHSNQIFISAAESLATADTSNQKSESQRVMDAALSAANHAYGSFSSALVGFHKYCCLTRVGTFWDSAAIYDTVYADTNITYAGGPVSCLARQTEQHTGTVYSIARDSSVHVGAIWLTVDRRPNDSAPGPFTDLIAQAVVLDASGFYDTAAFPPFDANYEATVRLSNDSTAWTKIYICVTNPDTQAAHIGEHRLSIDANEAGCKRTNALNIARPRGGNFAEERRSTYYPGGQIVNNGLFDESLAVTCSIHQINGTPEYADSAVAFVPAGDTVWKNFRAWDHTGKSGLYTMSVSTKLSGDRQPANDRHVDTFELKDTIIEPDTGTGPDSFKWKKDNGIMDFAEGAAKDLDGVTIRHLSELASCWHLQDSWPWTTNNSRYMCLRWHSAGDVTDWLWLAPINRWTMGHLWARFKMHLKTRETNGYFAAFGGGEGSWLWTSQYTSFWEADTVLTLDADTLKDRCDRRPLFLYWGDSTQIQDWSIDDFELYTDTLLASDIGLQALLEPSAGSVVVQGRPIRPTVMVRNHGCCEETCNVYVSVYQHPDSAHPVPVYSDTVLAVVPIGGYVKARCRPWDSGNWPDSGYDVVARAESWSDMYAANDTCRIVNAFRVVNSGIFWAGDYPLGKIKTDAAITSDGEDIYVKGGKQTRMVYRFNAGEGTGTMNWDTLPMPNVPRNPQKGGGVAYVPGGIADDTAVLYMHWCRRLPSAELVLGADSWMLLSDTAGQKLILAQNICWDGGTNLYAINQATGRNVSRHSIVRLNLTTRDSWRYVCSLPHRKIRYPGSMVMLGRKLYITGFKDSRAAFGCLDLGNDTNTTWTELEPIPYPGSSQVPRLAAIENDLYLLKDKPEAGIWRYDVAGNWWVPMEALPPRWGGARTLKKGACITSHGGDLYFFTGEAQELWRYVPPDDNGDGPLMGGGYAAVAPSRQLTPERLYGTPSRMPAVDQGGGQETALDTGAFETRCPRWSPDGNWLAYLKEDTAGVVQVMLRTVGGGSPVALTSDGCDKENLDWSPGSDWLVYQYEDDSGYSQFAKLPRAGGQPVVLSIAGRDCENPRWSSSGDQVVFQADTQGFWQIFTADTGGASLVQLTADSSDHECPVMRGALVVYERRDAAGWSQVYMKGPQSEAPLTAAQIEHHLPRFSNDGSVVVFEVLDSTGFVQVRSVAVGSPSYEHVLTSGNCDNEAPQFTPDGARVIFRASGSAGSQLCEVTLDGDSFEPLTPVTSDLYAYDCAPSGQWLAYAKEDSLSTDVGIYKCRRFLGSGISSFSVDVSSMDATRDSARVDFSIEDGANVALKVLPASGSAVRTLIDTHLAAGDYTYFWDGRKDAGALALPGNYTVKLVATDSAWADSAQAGLVVKGTLVPDTLTASATWTTASDPYVLSGHGLDINRPSEYPSAVLTIEPGVRVMFADSAVSRNIVVHDSDRIVANGTEQDSIYFMPYRKMAAPYNPAKRGWWGGISPLNGSLGGQFGYCVFENGGNCDSATVVYVHATAAGTTVDLDHCRFQGSAGHSVRFDDDNSRDRLDVDDCAFEYCASYPIHGVRAVDVAGICATCSFANNDTAGLMVHNTDEVAERIETSCTWPCMSPGWHYDLDGDLQVWGDTGDYPTLTVGAGTSIRMPTNGEVRIGNSDGATNYGGAIVAAGTPGAPVVFEGLDGATWEGVLVDWDPDNLSAFRYATFKEGTGTSRLTWVGMSYFPMLHCRNSPQLYRCKFLDAYREHSEERGVGFGTEGAASYVSQCKFARNEIGIVADYAQASCCTTYNCLIDSGDIGLVVFDLPDSARVYLRSTNVFGNGYGVYNFGGNCPVDANGNWWGPNGTGENCGRPGWQGNNGVNDTNAVKADTWSTSPFAIWSMDAEAVSILEPVGWHVPGVVVPSAVVRNYLDTTVTFTATLGIGSEYRQTVAETLAASAVDTLLFPQLALDSGRYNLGLAVDLAGDEDPSNDSVSDTVWVRDSVDAAAVAVLAPPLLITVDDTIEPRVSIANYGALARQVPVEFYLDSAHVGTESAMVAAGETAEVSFEARVFRPGSHQVLFVCCLPLDDDRGNDTVAASVYVKAGDYWTPQDSPPFALARMCWDRSQHLYAAERNGTGVARYNTLTHDWSAVASPPVETVFGIAGLKGQVYVLGNAASADEGRRQKSEVRRQNDGLADGGNGLRLTANSLGLQDAGTQGQSGKDKGLSNAEKAEGANGLRLTANSPADEGRRQNAEGRMQDVPQTTDKSQGRNDLGHNPNSTAELGYVPRRDGQGLGIYRYVAAGDSWVLVTACDTTLVPGNGSALVGDDAGSLYLIEGGTDRVLRYVVAADSWVSDAAPTAIDRYGAAGWSRGKLYALASADTLLEHDTESDLWSVVAPPGSGTYGTALCADPIIDRLYAFCGEDPIDRGPLSSRQRQTLAVGGRFRERWNRSPTPTWMDRGPELADTTGASLCFVGTQAYCLDGYGAFWRYRPEPILDAAAVAKAIPDTVPLDTMIELAAIVQNGWQDTLPLRISMKVGLDSGSVQEMVAPQSWDTVVVASASYSPGKYPITLVVELPGDTFRYDDTVADTLTVRFRRDVEASAVLSPLGRIPWTSLVEPSGVVENNAGESLSFWAKMTIDTGYVDSVQVVLGPLGSDTVEFDTCHLRIGEDTAVLSVRLAGDEVSANDQAHGPFEILAGDFWVTLATPPYAEVRMTDGPDDEVFTAATNATDFSRYSIAADSWYAMAPSPLLQQMAVCRRGNKVFAVGYLSDMQDGGLSRNAGPAKSSARVPAGRLGVDGPSALVVYDDSASLWDTLNIQLPVDLGPGCCLFAADDTTVFLLGLGIENFQRYSLTQDLWTLAPPMPGLVGPTTSGCSDGAGRFFVLNDSVGCNGVLWSYRVGQDSWQPGPALNRPTSNGSALTCDPARGRLYALWADDSSSFFGRDADTGEWESLEPYPGPLMAPVLAEKDGNVYGQNGPQDSSFCRYIPVPELDVAALEMLAPLGTERYDSTVTPTGVVENLSAAPVWCSGSFTCDSVVSNFPTIYLAPGQTDTVTAGPVYLPAGRQTAAVQFSCPGDANPANDTFSKTIQVDAPWEPREAPAFAQGRLDADAGTSVFAAACTSAQVARYDISGDSWLQLPVSPFTSGISDLSYYNSTLYALGYINSGTLGAVGAKRAALPPADAGPAIYRLGPGDTAWTMVAGSLPSAAPLGGWIVATGQGIYLEPGSGREFFRYDSSGWTARCSLPVSLDAPGAMDWDRDDSIFLSGVATGTQGTYQAMLSYSLGQDAWTMLAQVPVISEPGLALAAQPDSGIVLALVALDTGNAVLYAYSRAAAEWSQEPSPGWPSTEGAAMTFAGAEAWALTGASITPSWFWCYDPLFESAFDRGVDGVAGGTQRALRWACDCAPNPLTAGTVIRWQAPRTASVTLRVYNTAGRLVKTLAQGEAKPGTHLSKWDGTDSQDRLVSAGVYLVKLSAEGFAVTRKLVVQR